MTTTSTFTWGFRAESGTMYSPGYLVGYDSAATTMVSSIAHTLANLSASTTTSLGLEIKLLEKTPKHFSRPIFRTKARHCNERLIKERSMKSRQIIPSNPFYKGHRWFAHAWGIAR